MSIEELAKKVLALPANERAQLADQLVESLDPASDIAFGPLWAAEALRRRDEVRAGKVLTIPGDEAIRLAREAAGG